MTMAGLEVDSVEPAAAEFSGIVVGEVLEVIAHPNADKLRICKVAVGENEPLQIVCGASNIKAGDKVPVAPIGITLPNGITIEQRKIRGTTSEGMLCAEDELGLGEDRKGILILDRNAKIEPE